VLDQAAWFGDHSRAFRLWAEAVMEGIRAEYGGLYFVATRAPGGRLALLDAELSLECFRRWGFEGRELFRNKAMAFARDSRRARTWHSAERRRYVLDALVQEGWQGSRRLRTEDYRAALEGLISDRQAQLDLAAHPRLRARGNTRARWYEIVRAGD
jgi:hypothetical protein